ncbi:MAG: META domain-containing protein [Nitrospira sp.]|nr:META domain-containing protein [Nitrospira sp.]
MVMLFMIVLSVEVSVAADLREGSPSVTIGSEGIEWRLVEVGGEPVSPLANEKQPYIMFDPAQKRATGFAGCNNSFGSYELDGASLKFGSVGSTRRACPDMETGLETEFFKALEKTRGWKIRDGNLLLLEDEKVLARFTMVKGDETAVDLESMTFLSTWFPSGKVTLSHGEYREAAAPGSASEIVVKLTGKRVFGLVNGRQTGAAVLVTDPGGSGTFYDLALLTKEAEGWVNADTVLLGDRVKVHSVEIKDNFIVIVMTTHGPNDPMCCPTLEVQKRFTVEESHLVPVAEGTKCVKPQITGTVWQWVRTLYSDDRKSVPAKPENYTIRFLEDGKINVKADCNVKGGVYSTEGKRLSIEITHSTMAACEEGSLEEQFIRDLTAGAIFFFQDGDLYIDMKYDSGTIKFSRQKEN